MALGYNFVGAQSDINIWNPSRVEASDYSTAQIWLVGGLSDTFESLEAGWMVRFYIAKSIVLYFALQVNRDPIACH